MDASGVKESNGGPDWYVGAQKPTGVVWDKMLIGISRKISPIFWPHLHDSTLTHVAKLPACADTNEISPVSFIKYTSY